MFILMAPKQPKKKHCWHNTQTTNQYLISISIVRTLNVLANTIGNIIAKTVKNTQLVADYVHWSKYRHNQRKQCWTITIQMLTRCCTTRFISAVSSLKIATYEQTSIGVPYEPLCADSEWLCLQKSINYNSILGHNITITINSQHHLKNCYCNWSVVVKVV